mmetsp:Transcript_35082/g.34113  ORF Transcript_35082/g.34113 Transcript_35082/m.34113 type:complete len:100 (+) Transcript_35082:270-569(+)
MISYEKALKNLQLNTVSGKQEVITDYKDQISSRSKCIPGMNSTASYISMKNKIRGKMENKQEKDQDSVIYDQKSLVSTTRSKSAFSTVSYDSKERSEIQ